MSTPQIAPASGEAFFRQLFESSTDAYLLLKDNLFVDCNPATVEMLRARDRQQVLNTHPSVLSPPVQPDGRPSGEKADEMIVTALAKGSHRFEWMHRRMNGEDFLVEVLLTPIQSGEDMIIFTVWREIGERKRSEEALRASEARFRQLFEGSADAYLILHDNLFVDCNPATVEMLRARDRQQVLNTHPSVLSPPVQPDGRPSGEKADEMIATALAKGSHRFEWMHRRIDGEDFLVEVLLTPIQSGNDMIIFTVWREIGERKRLEKQVHDALERRGYQVRISTEIAQQLASVPAVEDVFNQVVRLVKEQFGYYHVQLLRYNPAIDAVALVAGYGEIGKQMLEAGHQMPLGQGLIGGAAERGETLMRPDLRNDPLWQSNPLLPETHGEIAVPIKLRDEVLGVLDVQSNRAGALGEDDRLLLEGLCGQVAVAIESTRLRQEMESRLAELDSLYRATTRQGWQRFASRSDRQLDYFYTVGIDEAVPAASDLWLEETERAISTVSPSLLQTGRLSGHALAEDASDQALALPLALRGEVLGALAIRDDPTRPLSSQELDLLQAISEQVALALESARLFEQTQTALAETETLYAIIAEMNAANSYHDILTALVSRTLLNQADRMVMMALFDKPLVLSEVAGAGSPRHGRTPEWIHPVAHLSEYDIDIAQRYPISAFEVEPGSIFIDQPVIFSDMASDPRLDRITRTLFQQVFQAQSSLLVPLLLGNQIIGFIQGYYGEKTTLPEDDVQRLVAVAGQAAIAVQSRLLLDQAQERASQERRIRAVTAQVFGAADVDSILRRTVEEVGRVLGLPAYIRLSTADAQTSQSDIPGQQSAPDETEVDYD